MSNRVVISVENLGKTYRISHQAERRAHLMLRDVIAEKFEGLFRPRSRQRDRFSSTEDFWALRNVGFKVRQGEVIGIIGRNGAGKSTLLKILSRIAEPSEGRVRIKGRVASLLEVGTGFHAELTGRENIYLNGAILGMRRAEIKRKFDEIVAFAGVETFLDTPVKRYSSGMYVRLAFAVAAHLEPEILIVDEVLAVGDAEFQKKCLGKMHDVSAHEGRTVLFVSHSMAAVDALCSRALLLEAGKLQLDTDPSVAIQKYLSRTAPSGPFALGGIPRKGTGEAWTTGFHVESFEGEILRYVQSGQSIRLVFTYQCKTSVINKPLNVGFGVHGALEEVLFVLYASQLGKTLRVQQTNGRLVCTLPRLPLNPGKYGVLPRIEICGTEADFPHAPVGFIEVVDGDFYGSKQRTDTLGAGAFLVDGDWMVES